MDQHFSDTNPKMSTKRKYLESNQPVTIKFNIQNIYMNFCFMTLQF